MKSLESASQQKLNKRKRAANFRTLPSTATQIDFWSNNYLGLSAETVAVRPAGSTGSRLLSGNSAIAEQVENQIARFHGFEAGLLFGSGYDANLGLLACIAGRTDSLILDELAHASLIDGARLSTARRFRFRHNNLDDLSEKLQRVRTKRPDGNVIVVVEGTYSMDGDHAPLVEIVNLCERFDAAVIVDEAHSLGVIGDRGEGLVASLNLQSRVAACVYTFGKAVGYHGAVVAGGSWLRNYLINFCRPFIYSTAPPVSSVQTIAHQHERMVEADSQRQDLRRNIEYFRQTANAQLSAGSGRLLPSSSPIQGLVVGESERCCGIENTLSGVGITVKAILPPTVAAGSERIRICIHSYNTTQEIDLLIETLVRTNP